MKIGTIATPNAKGQIVIPKAMRDVLGISPKMPVNVTLRGDGIYIHPVREVIGEHEAESSYLKVLEKTAGAWRGDSWPQTERKRRKIELAASKRMKKAW